jgi:hypothetical protein
MTRQRGWPAGGAAAIAVALLIAACGGGEGTDSATADGGTTAGATGRVSTPSGTPSATSTSEAEPSPSATRTARTQAPAEEEAFAYVPWGPDDPPVPQRYASLAATSSSAARCDDTQANKIPSAFWDLAVSVCRAVAGEGPWPSATSVPAPPPPTNAYEACLDAELAAMLQRAVRWRAAHPGATAPQVRYPARSALSPCQTRVFETRVLPDDGRYSLPPGFLAVLVFAGSADGASTVTVDGQPAEVFDVEPASGSAALVVLVPAPAQAKTVPVAVTTTRGVLTSTVALPAGNPTSTTAPPGGGTPTDGASTGGATPSTPPSGNETSTPAASATGSVSP